MNSLASELILEVLENLYYTKESRPDHISLANCSLISPAWTSHAQKLLFRSLELQSAAKARLLDLTTAYHDIGRRSLAEHVRILRVSIEMLPGGVSPQIFAQLLTRCEQVYELRIWSSSVHCFDEDTLAILSKIPPIKALSILRTGVQSILLYQLISLLPTVRHLRILSELHATPPSEPAKFSLYEFVSHRAPHPDVLVWLLGASHFSLRILEMWDMFGRDTMHTVMFALGPYLRSLRLLHFNHQAALLVEQCHNLEEFTLRHVPTVAGLEALPPTIEHLAFRDPVHSHTPTLASIIAAVSELPKLRLVTCDENATRHVHFEMLRTTCLRRGVELRADALPFSVYEDMVPATQFPRSHSVSNFKLMN